MARDLGIPVTRALDAYKEPTHMLAAAVIVQTIQDMRGERCTPREQQDARTFLYSEWFEFLCEGLGLNYWRVRQMTAQHVRTKITAKSGANNEKHQVSVVSNARRRHAEKTHDKI